MRTRRRRRRTITVTTPGGTLYAVPKPTPLACLAHAVDPIDEHVRYLEALLLEKPAIALALMVQTARLAKQFTRAFGKRARKKGAPMIAWAALLLEMTL